MKCPLTDIGSITRTPWYSFKLGLWDFPIGGFNARPALGPSGVGINGRPVRRLRSTGVWREDLTSLVNGSWNQLPRGQHLP